MKQRFSSLDVKVITHELSYSLSNLRLANIYDLSSRIYLFKFARPDVRQSLIIESGFRCHLTDYTRATAAAPSVFVTRLRKFLKTRRVTSISQIGTDRIIEFQYSDGQYRLFLEFYAGGNIVLTNNELTVISLLRVVNEGEEQLRVGSTYLTHNRQNYYGIPSITRERVRGGLQSFGEQQSNSTLPVQRKPKRKPGHALRKALSTSLNEFPPQVIDHALSVTGLDPKTPVNAVLQDASLMNELLAALGEAQRLVDNTTRSAQCRGFIIAKSRRGASATTPYDSELEEKPYCTDLIYEDFHPFRPRQYEDNNETVVVEFDGYNRTVDQFFSSIESQKVSSRLTEREENAKRKLETAKLDHQSRLDGLQQVQAMNIRKAEAIEANLPRVQEAIAAVNGLLAQGMDWMDVSRLIEMEQAKYNVVAKVIKLPLKLYENSITLLLSETSIDEEDNYKGEETDSDAADPDEKQPSVDIKSHTGANLDQSILAVDVNLALSPWSNARLYYDQKKSAAVKEQKTLQSSKKALKSTEKKIDADLNKGLKQEKELMRPQRKSFWFEKFIYFISSEGYLVIGGKDAPQNEILYKRHLRKGDVYVHADLDGAASVIIKNKHGLITSPIPPSTLSQAGTLAVTTSSAWDAKASMSAWWVDAYQVSKLAPDGEYLTPGTFTVQGQKHFLPPAQLLLGFGLLFKVSEESKARHLKHRVQGDESAATNDSENVKKDVEVIDGEKDNLDERTGEDKEDQESIDEEEGSLSEGTGNIKEDQQGSSDYSDREALEVHGSDTEDKNGFSGSDSEQHNPLQPSYNAAHQQDRDSATFDSPSKMFSGVPSDFQIRNKPEIGSWEKASDDAPPLNDGNYRAVPDKYQSLYEDTSTDHSKAARSGNGNLRSLTSLVPSPSRQMDQSKIPTQKSQLTPRGKHNKRSKAQARYANQDEEDRALAVRLLGSSAAKDKADNEAISKAAKEQEMAQQRERRRRQHELAVAKGKESEKARRFNLEKDIETIDDDEKAEMDDIDAFVGAPLPGDNILDVLVVCGPWDAIGGRCRWRVKLQPGATKKGKAVREILGKWMKTIADGEKKRRPNSGEENELIEEEKVKRRETELIRALREPEVVGIVPVGKVRVVLGPGEAGGRGKGGGASGKGQRGGKGSKKQR